MTFDNFKHEEPGASAVAALLYLLLAQIAERGDLAAEGARGETACVRLFCQVSYRVGCVLWVRSLTVCLRAFVLMCKSDVVRSGWQGERDGGRLHVFLLRTRPRHGRP
jgi:hypothetical protein